MSESYFKIFRETVLQLGGVWASNDVYFSQFADGYMAAYLPAYPEEDEQRDRVISFSWPGQLWSIDGKDADAVGAHSCAYNETTLFENCLAAKFDCKKCNRCVKKANITNDCFLAVTDEDIGICVYVVFSVHADESLKNCQLVSVSQTTDEQAWQAAKMLALKYRKQLGVQLPVKLYSERYH